VPRPRDPGQILAPTLLATKRRLDALIPPEESQKEAGLPIYRLTDVHGSVF